MQDKPLKEYNPKEVLLNCDAITNEVTRYLKWQEPALEEKKFKESSISFIVEIVLGLFAIAPSWNAMSSSARTISIIILTILSIIDIFYVKKWIDARNALKGQKELVLENLLLERAKEEIKFTGIARVTYIHNSETFYLINDKNFLPHCDLDNDSPISEQKDNILQSLHSEFDINENCIIEISPIDNKIHYSIKPLHGSVQMNAFVFYNVLIKEQEKERITTTQNDKRKWASIDQMKKNPLAMSTNKDVIDLLEGFHYPNDSFENASGKIKVIWNVTSKCPYNCAICATHDDNREELELKDKYKVLNSLCTAKHLINNLDFAGGDPLWNDENITLIHSAMNQLGNDTVSVTTTGKSLSALSKDSFPEKIGHCEITIDASHYELQSGTESALGNVASRNENEYSKSNIESISLISGYAKSLTINVPLIDDDLSDAEINNLVKKIEWIKTHTMGIDIDVSLIRLMPVGKLSNNIDKDKYSLYNPIPIINKIRTMLKEIDIVCRLHCSLRVLPSFNNDIVDCHCSMLENKLGIDCAGNVFACAWGGYIQNGDDSVTKNPFYLGNLTEVPLMRILDGAYSTKPYSDIICEIDNKNYREYCSVVSYFTHKERFLNFDPLAQDDYQNS